MSSRINDGVAMQIFAVQRISKESVMTRLSDIQSVTVKVSLP